MMPKPGAHFVARALRGASVFAALHVAAANAAVPADAVAPEYIEPTTMPAAPAAQRRMLEQLVHKPEAQRSPLEWKQIAMLETISASEAADDDNASLDTADNATRAAIARLPNDPELIAVAGSVAAMRGRDPALAGSVAMAYAHQGFRQMDRAVAMNERNLGARLQRGISSVRSPAFLGRTQSGEQDLQFVLDHDPPSASPEAVEFHAMLLFLIGEAEATRGGAAPAAAYYRQAAELKAPVWSSRAQKRLEH